MSTKPQRELGPVLREDAERHMSVRWVSWGPAHFEATLSRHGVVLAEGSGETTFAAVDAALDALTGEEA